MPENIREIIAKRGLEGAIIHLAEQLEKSQPQEQPQEETKPQEPEKKEGGWQSA